MGREPTEEEFAQMKALAELELSIAAAEEKLDRYLEASTKKLMPNITYLIDYKIAAELLGKAGSLAKLSMMPSGTIQLLGAEKALFKHIKFGSKPPKYGALFKLQQVGGASKFSRGRIARLYATKIAIASRADAISKNFIADKLKEQIEKAVKAQEGRPHMPERRSGQSGARQRQREWQNRRFSRRQK
jgi:nucleolar protein 56